MEKYITQLLDDIALAAENISWPVCPTWSCEAGRPFVEREVDLHDWISEKEEDRTAPVRDLEEWTSIHREQLPPPEMLNDNQVERLLAALTNLLDACNWSFVLQTKVPKRIQYAAIRANFNQQVRLKRWHQGFFEHCPPGTEHGQCTLGEYCQCAFYAELFAGFSDGELSPEEERARELEIEIEHLKRKHGTDWMKYYPYHLDPNEDDKKGSLGDLDEDDPDDWWRP